MRSSKRERERDTFILVAANKALSISELINESKGSAGRVGRREEDREVGRSKG